MVCFLRSFLLYPSDVRFVLCFVLKVTKPSLAMRQQILDCEVGDDVFGDGLYFHHSMHISSIYGVLSMLDPTVQKLEARMSELTNKEASLFVPSG